MGKGQRFTELLQGTDDSACRQARIDLNGQDLAVGFVDDVQGSKGLAVVKSVMHEVQGPGNVFLGWGDQRLLG